MTNVLTREEIVKNFETKDRNIYVARITSVYPQSLMMEIENSVTRLIVFAKDIATLRLRNLQELFAVGEAYPVAITEINEDEDGRLKIFGSMKPIWGGFEEMKNIMKDEALILPIAEERVGTSQSTQIVVTPNIMSFIEYQPLSITGIKASLRNVTDRRKVRLNVHGFYEAQNVNRLVYLKELFHKYKKGIEDMAAYIDIEEFNESLKILPRTEPVEDNIQPSTPIYAFTTNSIAYPQEQKPYNSYVLASTVSRISTNPALLNTLKTASFLFRGLFTADMLKEINDNQNVNASLIGTMLSTNMLSCTKIVEDGIETAKVYFTSNGFRNILANGATPLRWQSSTDAAFILRELSVSKMLIEMYKNESQAILNELKRNWFISEDASNKKSTKYRAIAILTESKIVIDSCRDIEHIKQTIDKLKRMDIIHGSEYKVYITCRNDAVEEALRAELSKLPTTIRIFTTTDEKYKESMHLGEVAKVQEKKKGFFKTIGHFISTL